MTTQGLRALKLQKSVAPFAFDLGGLRAMALWRSLPK
jgi:hypothetical protein